MKKNNITWINTVEAQGNKYLVNKKMLVPKVDGNRHYEDIKIWLKENEL